MKFLSSIKKSVSSNPKTVLSYVIILSFFGVIVEIGHAMHTNTELSGEWKEVLLLLLGALIGAFGKVVDYWFGTFSDTTPTNEKTEEE